LNWKVFSWLWCKMKTCRLFAFEKHLVCDYFWARLLWLSLDYDAKWKLADFLHLKNTWFVIISGPGYTCPNCTYRIINWKLLSKLVFIHHPMIQRDVYSHKAASIILFGRLKCSFQKWWLNFHNNDYKNSFFPIQLIFT
jgi:hypothetical protein